MLTKTKKVVAMEYKDASHTYYKFSELNELGINQKSVFHYYNEKTGKILKLNDLIKVVADDEGKNIKFETLDQISIIVPADRAFGSFNKID